MFGVTFFSAVINPPQACILAIGAGVPRVAPPKAGQMEPRVLTTVQVQLSHDRRVVDEATASQFLQVLQKYLSDTNAMIM
jgi:pyruvate dehydrogenase E2 component (dihydrolipoamide acetyltransferase)